MHLTSCWASGEPSAFREQKLRVRLRERVEEWCFESGLREKR
jgi:hypothetical protein